VATHQKALVFNRFYKLQLASLQSNKLAQK